MSNNENTPSPGEPLRKHSGSALHMGPWKKVTSSNPLVLHGQHFGRTVFALCNYPALLTTGILRLEELQDSPIEDFPAEVFTELVDSYPSLLDRLMNDKEEDVLHMGELDAEDPWKGLLRSEMLVFGFKHVFTLPSSVDKEPKAMCSGNAYLHGMKSMIKGSFAYIAMQIQFSLSSLSVFSCTDTVTDSKNFYHSILDLLEDPDESEEVGDLMTWWTRLPPKDNSPTSLCPETIVGDPTPHFGGGSTIQVPMKSLGVNYDRHKRPIQYALFQGRARDEDCDLPTTSGKPSDTNLD
ncbi:hypothetical protein F4604DRAFT_1925822 [Suillus subluteus]|nr:hypothetical protein F4604DRAFT_1925822 [Suillus subluteus]